MVLFSNKVYLLHKIFIILLIFFSTSFATNYPKLYLQGGIKAVQAQLHKELESISFWESALKGEDLSLGFYPTNVAIALTNKTKKEFRLYYYDEGKLSLKLSQDNVLTGLLGDKQKRGDLKTPVGFYEVGKRFYPGDQYYGPFAFATSYPNLYDKLQGKTGYGIWIHGYPLDGKRLDKLKTEGCIALRNKKLKEFYTLVKNRPLFVYIEEKTTRSTNKQIAALLASLYGWKQAWTDSSLQKYLSFYDKQDFKRYDHKSFAAFVKMKSRIFAKGGKKQIKFSKLTISPYPSNTRNSMFRISFYEDYKAPNYSFKGDKILYVYLNSKDKMQILAEQ